MALREDFLRLSETARPRILKLARRQMLVDECFKEFQRRVYPSATPEQTAQMRVCFFAGASELLAMLMYGTSLGGAVTQDDEVLMDNITTEIELFYSRVIGASSAGGTRQ